TSAEASRKNKRVAPIKRQNAQTGNMKKNGTDKNLSWLCVSCRVVAYPEVILPSFGDQRRL
ncbi:MAG: hypothetical protein WA869_36340, partial [Alloacidobacterium sp.]